MDADITQQYALTVA